MEKHERKIEVNSVRNRNDNKQSWRQLYGV